MEAEARRIVKRLRESGKQAYYVGGCVRDKLLGVESKAIDVTTAATPDHISQLFPQAVLVGVSFGVALVGDVEVATFRHDHDYSDGRRPDAVTFTESAEQDVLRRDFTINGLLYNPLQDEGIDHVGGRNDLEARLVRAIGEPADRFAEDKLRMLRAVRFAARLGFSIEASTLAAIQASAEDIGQVSAERVRDELVRILIEGGGRRGLELLDEAGLLQAILPEVSTLKGVEQSPQHHPEGDVFTHTIVMLEGLARDCVPTLAMGVLLHDIGKPATFQRAMDRIRFNGHAEKGVEIAEGICERLRFSNAETEQIVALVANHMRFMHVRDMRVSRLKRFLRAPRFDEHLALHRLDCLSSHGRLDNYEFTKSKLEEFSEEELRPEPLVTGNDLIAAGFAPGPAFKQVLQLAEDAQLEGRATTKEEALAIAVEALSPGDDPIRVGGPGPDGPQPCLAFMGRP